MLVALCDAQRWPFLQSGNGVFSLIEGKLSTWGRVFEENRSSRCIRGRLQGYPEIGSHGLLVGA